jgi:hypothetical protein
VASRISFATSRSCSRYSCRRCAPISRRTKTTHRRPVARCAVPYASTAVLSTATHGHHSSGAGSAWQCRRCRSGCSKATTSTSTRPATR